MSIFAKKVGITSSLIHIISDRDLNLRFRKQTGFICWINGFKWISLLMLDIVLLVLHSEPVIFNWQNLMQILCRAQVWTAICVFVLVGFSLAATINSIHEEVFRKPLESIKLVVPALLYVVQNSLLLVALSNLNSATYQVTHLPVLVCSFQMPENEVYENICTRLKYSYRKFQALINYQLVAVYKYCESNWGLAHDWHCEHICVRTSMCWILGMLPVKDTYHSSLLSVYAQKESNADTVVGFTHAHSRSGCSTGQCIVFYLLIELNSWDYFDTSHWHARWLIY